MNVLVILAHPERASFNGGLADVAVNALEAQGHTVKLEDLYGQGFDPVERAAHYLARVDDGYFAPLTEQRAHYEQESLPDDVQRQLALLDWAELVIFQFPLWWHGQPAILKGWFDRVLVYGGRYSGSMRYNRGYFSGKRAMVSVTTGSPKEAFKPFGRAGNIVHWLWPMHSSLYYVGFDVLSPQLSYGVQGGGIQYQQEGAFRSRLETMKVHWSKRLYQLEQETPIPFTGWDDWDSDGLVREDHPMRWRVSG